MTREEKIALICKGADMFNMEHLEWDKLTGAEIEAELNWYQWLIGDDVLKQP